MKQKTIKGIPITDNFVRFDDIYADHENDTFRIPWNKPNTDWKVRHCSGKRTIITNIQYDDSPHSPNLFLYSNLGRNENSTLEEIIKDNTEALDGNRNWLVKQMVKSPDRPGIRRFSSLPLGVFMTRWRKKITPDKIIMNGTRLHFNLMKFTLLGPPTDQKFNCFMDWPDVEEGRLSEVHEWLKEYCKDGIYLFSDSDSMFDDIELEFAYIASWMIR